jgi:Domain of unknown function (DUF4136)
MNPLQVIPAIAISRRTRHVIMAAFAVVWASAFAIGGCASTPQQPHSMHDPQANFGAYKTFAWNTDGAATASGQPTSIVEGYVRAAITNEMKRKGYEEAAAGTTPDLRIEYEASKAEKLKNNPFRIGVGVGSYGSSGGGGVSVGSPSVKNVTEGSLVIHVIDAARNAEAWRSGVTRELGKGNVTQATVNAAVADAMADLPARTAQ